MDKNVDFRVTDHGSIVLFAALTEAATEHFDERMPEDAMTLGGAYAVEHRFAADILDDIIGEGFAVTFNGERVN